MSAPVFGDLSAIAVHAPTVRDEIDRIEIFIDDLEQEWAELDDERSAIARRQDEVEDELADQRRKLGDLKSDKVTDADEEAWVPYRFTCLGCGFDVESYGFHSIEFRAECHHQETGHPVAILAAGAVVPFDRPICTIGARV